MQFNYLYIDGILDFKKAEFKLNDINIFLGANNTGKSSVFRILELLQNSLDIYKESGMKLNFEGTKLSTIKNINIGEITTFKLPFVFFGASFLELRYNDKGELFFLEIKDNDSFIIKMDKSNLYFDFQKIIKYLDDEFVPKENNIKKENPFPFISSSKREKVDRSALSLVNEALEKKKKILKKKWSDSFLQNGNYDKNNSFTSSICNTEKEIMKKLLSFLNKKSNFFDFDINMRKYSRFVVDIFNFLSALEVLSDEKNLSYNSYSEIKDSKGKVIDVEKKLVSFLEKNKNTTLFTEKFKYLLDVIRLSIEKSFLELIELFNNILQLSAIRLNTISPYIVDTNGEMLNDLSRSFFNSTSIKKEFVNDWLEKMELGKIAQKSTMLDVGLEIKALIFYKKKNNIVDITQAFTLNKVSTGTLQVIVLLMKISLSKTNSILCIEEPEINLHPRLQTIIADMLEDATKKFRMKFIVETHNEYMISQFQNLVAKEK